MAKSHGYAISKRPINVIDCFVYAFLIKYAEGSFHDPIIYNSNEDLYCNEQC